MHKTTATRSVLKAVLILILLGFFKRAKKKEKWFCNDKSFEGTEDENDRVLGGILVDARKGSNPISAFLVFPTMDLSPGERKVGETWSKG